MNESTIHSENYDEKLKSQGHHFLRDHGIYAHSINV